MLSPVNKYRFNTRQDENHNLILYDLENSLSTTPLVRNFSSPTSDADSNLDNDDTGQNAYAAKKPIFTVIYVTSVVLLFLCGVYFIAEAQTVTYGMFSPISPPLECLYFSTTSQWPTCQDRRSQWWRLFSHQLVHAGYLHLLSNQIMCAVFGSFYEAHQGFWRTLVVSQLSILAGCMGHAAVWPLRSLIGNSHGVYGLFGACMAEVIINADMMPTKTALLLLLMCFVQLSIDILGFMFWFNPHVGYSAHTAGFLAGLLLSFSFSSRGHSRVWKYLLGGVCLVFFTGCLGYELHHYETTWPPEAFIKPSWSEVSSQTCCADALYYQEAMGVSQDVIVEHYNCDGWDLVQKQ